MWFPTTFLMIETLRKLEKGFGDAALHGVAWTLAQRLISIFTPDADGYRPVYGPRGTRKAELFAHDPHWRDLVLFHEYFHAETGEGLGAAHQTGWTGLVANLIDEWRRPLSPAGRGSG